MISSFANRTSDFLTLLISGLSFNFSIATINGMQSLFNVKLDFKVHPDPFADDFGANGIPSSLGAGSTRLRRSH